MARDRPCDDPAIRVLAQALDDLDGLDDGEPQRRWAWTTERRRFAWLRRSRRRRSRS